MMYIFNIERFTKKTAKKREVGNEYIKTDVFPHIQEAQNP